MSKFGDKINTWEKGLKNKGLVSVIVVLVALLIILGIYMYNKTQEYNLAAQNSYNMSFYQLVDYF